MDSIDYQQLREFAKSQAEIAAVDAMIEHGTSRAAAEAIGKCKSSVNEAIARVKLRAGYRGFAPDHDMRRTAPESHYVKGTSTLYGDDGSIKAQWVKTDLDKSARLQLLKDWVSGLIESVDGLKLAAPAPQASSSDRLAAYVMGDPHLGMYAWAEETGDDFNLDIATGHLFAAADELVDSAPESDEAIIVNLGDFFHADTPDNRTAQSGNPLDVDTRHAKVFRAGCEVFERVIDRALQKHREVTVYITKGNHDPESSFALAEVLRALYRQEPRVTINGGIRWREYHQFGTTLLGITHGDKAKPPALAAIMAAEVPALWGATTCRRWLVGHFHHQDRKEYPGCIVEIFPTLAAKDAWHASMGYLSERAMTCIVYHREHGEQGRRIVGVPELARRVAA